jgi:hypothetical protein
MNKVTVLEVKPQLRKHTGHAELSDILIRFESRVWAMLEKAYCDTRVFLKVPVVCQRGTAPYIDDFMSFFRLANLRIAKWSHVWVQKTPSFKPVEKPSTLVYGEMLLDEMTLCLNLPATEVIDSRIKKFNSSRLKLRVPWAQIGDTN